jgi:putative phosphonate metabolism protein
MCAFRYALYYAPPRSSGWWRFGARWLGRDPATGERIEQPTVAGLTREAFQAITAEPRKYGFHATLKAPFALREGATRKALADALARFCRARRPVPLPPLEVRRLADFLALVPVARASRVNELAADCMREFEAFRAPLAAAELERRRRKGLSPRQDRYLEEWGYPYVLAEYRFHLTLTGSLDGTPPHQVTALVAAARAALDSLRAAPLRLDAVCLFEQPEPAAPFRLVRRFLLGGARR